MGLKFSSLCSKKKSKKDRHVEYSPRTAQEMYNARRNGKPIYPPLSSILAEEPRRSLLPNGELLYKPIYTDSERGQNDRQYDNERYRVNTSSFVNYHKQYDDGTFVVHTRQPVDGCHIFRL